MSLFGKSKTELETKVAELEEKLDLVQEDLKIWRDLILEKGPTIFFDVTDSDAAKEYITNLMLKLNKLQKESYLFHNLQQSEQVLKKKEEEADQKLAEADQKMESRQQHLNEMAISKFQIANLVKLLKKKNEEKIKSLRKQVALGKMSESNLDNQAKKLDREILETLKKRQEPGTEPNKPFFTYAHPRRN